MAPRFLRFAARGVRRLTGGKMPLCPRRVSNKTPSIFLARADRSCGGYSFRRRAFVQIIICGRARRRISDLRGAFRPPRAADFSRARAPNRIRTGPLRPDNAHDNEIWSAPAPPDRASGKKKQQKFAPPPPPPPAPPPPPPPLPRVTTSGPGHAGNRWAPEIRTICVLFRIFCAKRRLAEIRSHVATSRPSPPCPEMGSGPIPGRSRPRAVFSAPSGVPREHNLSLRSPGPYRPRIGSGWEHDVLVSPPPPAGRRRLDLLSSHLLLHSDANRSPALISPLFCPRRRNAWLTPPGAHVPPSRAETRRTRNHASQPVRPVELRGATPRGWFVPRRCARAALRWFPDQGNAGFWLQLLW